MRIRPMVLCVALLFAVGCGSPPQPATVTLDASRGGDVHLVAAEGPSAPVDPGPIPVTDADPAWGNRDALVTLVEFADFQCPFSRRAAKSLAALREKYGPSDLRIVWKNNPLSFHKLARGAHAIGEVAFEQRGASAFWAFYDAVYGSDAPFNEELYRDGMRAAGISAADVERGARRADEKVQADLALGLLIGVTGTPHFFVNGFTISGAMPIERFTEVIDAELAKARALVQSGTPRSHVYAERTADNRAHAPPPPPPSAPAPPPDTKTVFRVPIGHAPVRGKATALVTIVEFADYQCPFCSRAEPTLQKIAATYGDKVRLVYLDEPLPFHQHAGPASEVALEVRKRRGDVAFWKIHDALFAAPTHLEDGDLVAAAGTVGLDANSALAAIVTKKHQAVLDEYEGLAEDVDARGTPTFFINGRRLVGAQPFDQFQPIIDEEIAKAEALVKQGVARSGIYEALQKDARVLAVQPDVSLVAAPTAASPSRGPAGAKIVVQYFSDFQCPFCKRVEDTLRELEKAFPGQVRIVWRNFPLSSHPNAEIAAEAAMEAFHQKGAAGFWAMHDALFADPNALDRAGLERAAAVVGLDVGRFKAALDAQAHKAEIDADVQIGKTANITGTPGFVVYATTNTGNGSAIKGYFINGQHPLSRFTRVARLALARPAGAP